MALPRPDTGCSRAGMKAQAAEVWGSVPDLTSISSIRSIRVSRYGLSLPSPTGAEASNSKTPWWVATRGP